MQFHLPEGIPEGEYFIRVLIDGSRFHSGNRLPVFTYKWEGPAKYHLELKEGLTPKMIAAHCPPIAKPLG